MIAAGKCSKTRGSRNPQPQVSALPALPECSKTRGSRNPQRNHADGLHPDECSKTRGSRNPQRSPVGLGGGVECSKTRGSRNPQRRPDQGNRVNEQVTNRESSESMAPLDSRRGYQPWPTQQRLARRSTKLSLF